MSDEEKGQFIESLSLIATMGEKNYYILLPKEAPLKIIEFIASLEPSGKVRLAEIPEGKKLRENN